MKMNELNKCFLKSKKIQISVLVVLISILIISSIICYSVEFRTKLDEFKLSEKSKAESFSMILEKTLEKEIAEFKFFAGLLDLKIFDEERVKQLLIAFTDSRFEDDPGAKVYIVDNSGKVLQKHAQIYCKKIEEIIQELISTNAISESTETVIDFIYISPLNFEEKLWITFGAPLYNGKDKVGTIFLLHSEDWLRKVFRNFLRNNDLVFGVFSKNSEVSFRNLYTDILVPIIPKEDILRNGQTQWLSTEGIWTLSTIKIDNLLENRMIGILTLYPDAEIKRGQLVVLKRIFVYDVVFLAIIMIGYVMASIQLKALKEFKNLEIKQSQIVRDPITGLLERKEFLKTLDYMIEFSEKENKKLALIFLDIDDFTSVNQLLGPVLADNVLKRFGERLRRVLRKDDIIGRVGGDEFGIIALVSEEEDVVKLIDKITVSIKDPIELGKFKLFLNATSGIAMFPKDGHNPDVLMTKAFEALRIAKSSDTKKKYRFFGVLNG